MATNLFLITGDDEFAVKQKALSLVADLCGGEPENDSTLEIVQGDSDSLKPEEVIGELLNTLNTPPFLDPTKKVWLKHFSAFEKAFGSKATKELAAMMEQLLDFIKAGIPDDITLIIDGIGIEGRSKFYKACGKEGETFKLDALKLSYKQAENSRNIQMRINEYCQTNGKQLDPRAGAYLAEAIGSDTGRMFTEMDKIFCYVDVREKITLADCQAICSRTPEAMNWEFSDALLKGNSKSALDLISSMIDMMRSSRSGGSNPELVLLGGAISAFQNLAQVKRAMKELNLTGSVSKTFFYDNGSHLKIQYPDNMLLKQNQFRAYMLCQDAVRFSDRQLSSILNELLDVNRKLVSGGADKRIALEQMALKVTEMGKAS